MSFRNIVIALLRASFFLSELFRQIISSRTNMAVDPCRIPAGSFPVFSGAPGEDIEVFFLEFDPVCEAYGFPPVEPCENLLEADYDCSSPDATHDRDTLRYRFLRKSLKKKLQDSCWLAINLSSRTMYN